ncbi:MAG: PilZ domain-containing protein [Parvibaculaceae bacterium]
MFGRFMLPDMSEHPCQVGEITPDGAIFITTAVPEKDAQIVAYLDEIGRVEGVSGEAVPGGFRIVFSHTGQRKERFASRLSGRSTKNTTAGTDLRRHARFAPTDSQSHISLPDGRIYPCEIIDISLSGAAVKVDVMPSLGTYLMLGKMRGRIVRYVDSGIAIEFLKPLNTTQLSTQVR